MEAILINLVKDHEFCKQVQGRSMITRRKRHQHPTPVLLPGNSHGQRSLVGCSPWGQKESDTTERLHFHFSFSCIGEGNGNPLQCSCLENPRDGGAWWAALYGVALSRTRLKQLSSSSSSCSSDSQHKPCNLPGIQLSLLNKRQQNILQLANVRCFLLFYWIIVDLQCCVTFSSTAK